MKKKVILMILLCLTGGALLFGACAAPVETAPTEKDTPLEENAAPEEAGVTASPEPVSEPATARYEFPEGSMSLTLPEGWEYEVQTKEMKAREDGLVLCGIDFWPSAHPEMRLELGYWPDRLGMCGTGVTIEHVDFGGGLSAYRYTETIDGTVWLTLVYDHVGEREYSFVIQSNIGEALWAQYEAEIMDIAGTAVTTVTETIVD